VWVYTSFRICAAVYPSEETYPEGDVPSVSASWQPGGGWRGSATVGNNEKPSASRTLPFGRIQNSHHGSPIGTITWGVAGYDHRSDQTK
jgi:hypothetical protein